MGKWKMESKIFHFPQQTRKNRSDFPSSSRKMENFLNSGKIILHHQLFTFQPTKHLDILISSLLITWLYFFPKSLKLRVGFSLEDEREAHLVPIYRFPWLSRKKKREENIVETLIVRTVHGGRLCSGKTWKMPIPRKVSYFVEGFECLICSCISLQSYDLKDYLWIVLEDMDYH